MRDNLRLYHTILQHMLRFLPHERITRLRNLALVMSGLFLARSVHLGLIVRKWPLAAKLPSLENRLRRFLSNTAIDSVRLYTPVVRLLLGRFEGTTTPLRLLLDTTQLGRRHRLYTVSLAWRRRALPLAFCVVGKPKGHLNVREQKALLRRIAPLMTHFPAVYILGDSEFGQVELMRYCRRQGWHFVLRLRGHYAVRPVDDEQPGGPLCRIPLGEGQTRYLGAASLTDKHAYRVFIVMHWRRGEEEPWYLASDRPVTPQTLRLYSRRMWTEELYGDLKGHGFDLEATRLHHRKRLERLVLSVLLVFIWLIVLGSRVIKNGQRHLVDRRDRRDHSCFRIGWDYLEHCIRLGEPIPIMFSPYPQK